MRVANKIPTHNRTGLTKLNNNNINIFQWILKTKITRKYEIKCIFCFINILIKG